MSLLARWIVVVLCLCATPSLAADRYALVIGNDAYETLPPLKKAVNDAKAVGDALEGLGFTVLRGENQTLRQMQDSLFDLSERLSPGDTVFLFYAGHGVAIAGGNYLLPVDTPLPQGAQAEGRVRFAGLAEADLIAQVKEAGAQLTVVVLDACRDNPFATAGTRAVGGTRGLQRPPESRGVFGIYSAGFGETALDRLGEADPDPNSVFTRALVPALADPSLSLVDIAYKVNADVERLARMVGHEQNPAHYDQARGRDVFLAGLRPAAAATGPSGGDPCAGAESHYAAAERRNTAGSYRAHLERFPTCGYAPFATDALAALEPSADNTARPVMEAEISDCDRLAAHEADRDRPSSVPGVKIEDIKIEAVQACEQALAKHPNERRYTYQLGRALDSQGRYDDAMRSYVKAADAGSAGAMSAIGYLFDWGLGVAQDYAEAMRWYRKAADAGDASAMLNIGILFRQGLGVARDFDEAMRWSRKAADAGNAYAMHNVGGLFDDGQGVPADSFEAAKWVERALRGGDNFSRDQMRTNSEAWTRPFRKALQGRLKDAGVYDGALDGQFGPGTQTAIDAIFGKAG